MHSASGPSPCVRYSNVSWLARTAPLLKSCITLPCWLQTIRLFSIKCRAAPGLAARVLAPLGSLVLLTRSRKFWGTG